MSTLKKKKKGKKKFEKKSYSDSCPRRSKKNKIKIWKKNSNFFFENENLIFFKYYADGFAVGVAGYAEGRATPTAHVASPRPI